MMNKYQLIAENIESTVVAEYEAAYRSESAFQSEAQLEEAFIHQLQNQGYERLSITKEPDLIKNLRKQLEKLNDYTFSDNEWDYFFKKIIANPSENFVDKTTRIQEDYIQILDCDNGLKKNIYLIDKKNIHNNYLQILNQYETESGQRPNRYDVTVLVNGLPLVHIELKRRGVDLKEAFNQINRYKRESFWADSGLFEYVQLFVISNGTYTKYYSNTTRNAKFREQEKKSKLSSRQTSNSFEFTSWWADANNKPITDLTDFAKTFFAKHTLLNIICKYCILTADKLLLVMRPYQIVAVEQILKKINIGHNYKNYGSTEAGGYVWHTTGSGKTLTSFKAAQLASKLDFINKVLFVVDRNDLDYQTMQEYDKFEKGAANSNSNTNVLKKQLEDPTKKIIITTIQKLSILIKKEKGLSVLDSEVVFIFDECHRSQFGDMHIAITKAFKKYYLFGFTGTPIFTVNASAGKNPTIKTTEQAFGNKLHTYTILDAINDKNVLPFRIDYISTMREQENIQDEKVWDIDREKALAAPQRIENIVRYILEHFNQKTIRNSKPYELNALKNITEMANAKDRNKIEEVRNKIKLSGFNSIFAVSSISAAKLFYNEFNKQQENLPLLKRLKIATIFSFGVNDAQEDSLIEENTEDPNNLPPSDRDFLDNAIADYNTIFKTSFDTSADKFQNYYKDVSLRMKNREIDLLIVVNMFLTGFDATTLNTLWVDKNLRMHGLLQAYSRTNRILNSIKVFGNIVCFRNLENATNESIALFGNKDAGGIVLLKTFNDYYYGYFDGEKDVVGYTTLVEALKNDFPVAEMITGEENQKNFISLFSSFLKAKNILSAFDEFEGKEILSDFDEQDYRSKYIELYNQFRTKKSGDAENVNDDIVFEMEFIKQVEINIDYILELINKYHEGHLKDNEILITINKAVDSSLELRNKKDLIQNFISTLNTNTNVFDDWQDFVDVQKITELENLINEENLNRDNTYKFIENAFRDGSIITTGTSLTNILPPVSRFSPSGERPKMIEIVTNKLIDFFNRFWDISGGVFQK